MKAKPQTQTSLHTTSQTSADGMQEQIRRRAYELYELRGREDGHDVEDWLESESEALAKGTKADAAA